MQFLWKTQERTINALAIIAAAMVASFIFIIVYDVTVRSLGFRPPVFTSSVVEYGLLYVTMLGAPWLLRNKGHVYVETLTAVISSRARRTVEIFVYLLCLLLSLLLFWFSLELTIQNYLRGELDLRAFDMPRWLVYLPMPVCFFLLAVEFLRYLFGHDSLYERNGVRGSGL